jgi:hypothetical protein
MLPMRSGNFEHPVSRDEPREPAAPVMPTQGPYQDDMDDPAAALTSLLRCPMD